ncbi:hypothetical protein AAG906_010092 [Vitis piasezkii]
MKNQALSSIALCQSRSKYARKEQWKRGKASKVKRSKEDSSCSLLSHFWSTFRSPFSTCYIPFQISGSQESNASNRVRFGAEIRKIWPSEDNCSRVFSKYGCYVMAWMQSHGNFSHRKLLDFYPLVISYELLEGEVFNSKFCINPLEPISMAIERVLVAKSPRGLIGTIIQLPILIRKTPKRGGELVVQHFLAYIHSPQAPNRVSVPLT